MKNKVEKEGNEANGVATQKENSGKRGSKLSAFLKRKKAFISLCIALIVAIVWFMIQLRVNESHFNKEKAQLIHHYEITIDSLQIRHLTFATEVFSWSVRSELLRNNAENLNQLLTEFVKESGADLVQVINPANNVILLSSDKKFENITYTGLLPKDFKETVSIKDEEEVKIFTPVMGFNSMIGILLVVRER